MDKIIKTTTNVILDNGKQKAYITRDGDVYNVKIINKNTSNTINTSKMVFSEVMDIIPEYFYCYADGYPYDMTTNTYE